MTEAHLNGNGHAPTTATDASKLSKESIALKEQVRAMDEKLAERLKRKPPGKQQTTAELEQAIRHRGSRKEEDMQHGSLSIKQEKEQLKQIKQMKDDKKRMDEWEKEMEELRTKRSHLVEQQRQVSERQDALRLAQMQEDAAQLLQLPRESVVDGSLKVSEAMAEMLNTPLWMKRFRTDHQVVANVNPRAKSVRLAGGREAVDAATAYIQEYGDVSSQTIDVGAEEVGLLIGKKGSTLAQLQDSTGCALVIDKKDSKVTVVGPASAVAGAVKDVRELFETKKRVEVTIKYAAEQKGTLLGKGGSTINRISTESGAHLDLGKDTDYSIRVHGPAAAVKRAQDLLNDLLFLNAASVQTVDIPLEVIDAVVGKGGENVRRLQQLYKVSIDNLSQPAPKKAGAEDDGAADDRRGKKGKDGAKDGADKVAPRYKIRGSIEGVKGALKEILDIVDREKRVEEVVMVQSQHVGMLLGKGGTTINQIQRDSGAVLDMQKRADEGSSTQAVTLRGNKGQVRKASEALEAVLKYKAESQDVLEVDAQMMPLLIGKGGEEINRIRQTTGAAIDAERDPEKPNQFKIRGTKESVEAAMKALAEAVESNKRVGEHVSLPWHCIDMLIGPNAELLKQFEADYQVQVELPGQTLFSEVVGSGSFLTITSSLQLRGRKKHVDAAAAQLEVLSNLFAVESLQLDDDDAELLSSLCLSDDATLERVEADEAVTIRFEPLEGLLTSRGEHAFEALRKIRELLRSERPTELEVPCGAVPMALLAAAAGGVTAGGETAGAAAEGAGSASAALLELRAKCAPAQVSLLAEAVLLTAAGRVLPAAQQACEAWLTEHAEATERLVVPPEVREVMQQKLPELQRQHASVVLALVADPPSVSLRGPRKHMLAALEAARALVRQHALVEAAVPLQSDDVALVELRTRKQSLAQGVRAEVHRAEAMVRLRGNEAAVDAAKAELSALLAEAARCAVMLDANGAMIRKLQARAGGKGSGGETLLVRLQDQHDCAIVLPPAGATSGGSQLQLQLRGRADAVAHMQKALETQLDVDEHEVSVAQHMVPVIIGKGGATIRRLGEQSGAEFSLDRGSTSVKMSGRKLAVQKAMALLDELTAQFGAARDIPIKERQIALVIGRGGATIKALQIESGATINIAKDEFPPVLRLRGSQQAVELAEQLITAKLGEPAQGGRQNASRPPPGLGTPSAPPTTTAPPPGLAQSSTQ